MIFSTNMAARAILVAISISTATTIFAPTAAIAGPRLTLTTKYSISFLGINVGKMKNSITISDQAYSISGAVRANSVVSVVAKTTASFSGAGVIVGQRLVPITHNVIYKTSKKRGNIRLNFKDGNIAGVSVTPKIKYKPGTVPVEKAHLKNVLDPVSTLLFPVKATEIGNGRSICNRTLPVFDGKTRFNMVFSYKSSATAKAKEFTGTTFTCAVRYQPVSGIRPAKKNVKFMKANRDMQVTVARIGESNIYALFAFSVRTDKGTAAGRAYHFSVK